MHLAGDSEMLGGLPDCVEGRIDLKTEIDRQLGIEERDEPRKEGEKRAPRAVRNGEVVRPKDGLEGRRVLGEEVLDRLRGTHF